MYRLFRCIYIFITVPYPICQISNRLWKSGVFFILKMYSQFADGMIITKYNYRNKNLFDSTILFNYQQLIL